MSPTPDVAYSELSPIAQHTYGAMGLHPGETFTAPLLAATLAADRAATDAGLGELVTAGLITDLPDGSFNVHTDVQAHAKKAAAEIWTTDQIQARLHRAASWYLRTFQHASRLASPGRRVLDYTFDPAVVNAELPDHIVDADTALAWADRHRHILAAYVEHLADTNAVLTCHLIDAYDTVAVLCDRTADAAALCKMGLRSAEQLGDSRFYDRFLARIARILPDSDPPRNYYLDWAIEETTMALGKAIIRGDHSAVVTHFKTLALNNAYWSQQIRTVAGEGKRADALGRSAQQHFRLALQIMEHLNEPCSGALLHIEHGKYLVESGRADEAITELHQAHKHLSSPEYFDAYNLARVDFYLALAHRAERDNTACRSHVERALAAFTSLGAHHYRNKAVAIVIELDTEESP